MTTSSGSRPISTLRTRSSQKSRPDAPLILGIDPGSRVTGYGFIRHDRGVPRCERSGVIATLASLSFPDRLLQIHDALEALLAEMRPAEVAVESAYVRKSAMAALMIGHVRGVIIVAARKSGATVFEYTAPEVKMAVVRNGAAQKGQVEFMVRRLLPGLAKLREDEADALAVALCHAQRGRLRELGIVGGTRAGVTGGSGRGVAPAIRAAQAAARAARRRP
ncbi:MAG TPA: crossover junction endodeoxyribonuclease RuvC [Candidatus Dormibacteraeota bacterium]|nr:crossover junction endodeoxyribonuclease RuvC [Candidatus Dormibacteraeota bacterium]